MATSNIEVVQAVIDAQNRGDPKSVYRLYDPAIEWHDRGGWDAGTVHRGVDGVRAQWRDFSDIWTEAEYAIDGAIDTGRTLLTMTRMRGRASESGAVLERRVPTLWTIRDGLIVKVCVYNDLALALRELADELDS